MRERIVCGFLGGGGVALRAIGALGKVVKGAHWGSNGGWAWHGSE